MEHVYMNTLGHTVWTCDRQRSCSWQFNLEVSLGVRSRQRPMFDSPDRQIMSAQRLQYWTRATQEVEKCCRGETCLIFPAVYIDSGFARRWTNTFIINFHIVFYSWMKQTFCDLEEERKKKLPTWHHRRGAKRLWKPSGGKRVLELGCVNDWTGSQEEKLCSTSTQYFVLL